MTRAKAILCHAAAALVLMYGAWQAQAQDGFASRAGKLMPYIIDGKDTIFLSPIPAARVYERKPRQKGSQWRKYYRQVYNFAKVYPYALVAKDIVKQADSTIAVRQLKYISKEKYVNAIVKELFNSFEKPLKNMTVTQGQMLMLLIDRECNICPYEIIRNFKNGYAAGFWQGVSKMFGNDLKRHYDPKGSEAVLESLVGLWRNGRFEQTYYEIFWDYPPMVELPEKYRTPDINQGQRQSRRQSTSQAPQGVNRR